MIAGSIAGIFEHVAMLPFDIIKTHIQTSKSAKFSYSDAIRSIYKQGGIREFYRGGLVLSYGVGPAHAIYFSVYEASKNLISKLHGDKYPAVYGLAGISASFVHDVIMTPCDVIKQRRQLMHNQGSMEILRKLVRNEGFFQLYRSLPITLAIGLPWQGLFVGANESLKGFFGGDHEHNAFSYFLCAGIAGGFAAAVTIPLDNIKTRLQTQGCTIGGCHSSSHVAKPSYSNLEYKQKVFFSSVSEKQNQVKYKNIRNTVEIIFREEGLRGFSKGVLPRVLSNAPSSAISWTVYEMMKRFFAAQDMLRH